MPDITDAAAITFCDRRIRKAANALAQAFNLAKRVVAEWNAHGGAAFIKNSAEDNVLQADSDGRPRITGADVNNLINRLNELITSYEANGAAELHTVLAVAVHTERSDEP